MEMKCLLLQHQKEREKARPIATASQPIWSKHSGSEGLIDVLDKKVKLLQEAQERDVSQDVYLVAIKLIPFSVTITDDMLCSMFKWKFNDHYLRIIDQVVELLITEDEKGSAVILFKIFQWS